MPPLRAAVHRIFSAAGLAKRRQSRYNSPNEDYQWAQDADRHIVMSS
jgi:hypothetical protein